VTPTKIEVEEKPPAALGGQSNSLKTKNLSLLKADESMDPVAAKMFKEAEEKRISEEAKIL